ncbi:7518_t:CDS:2, partial [Funneliformis geosporum]
TIIAEASNMFYVLSTLEEGTTCHAYITDCKGHVLFNKSPMDCSGSCLVTKRDNVPDGPYCPHMILHQNSGPGLEKHLKLEGNHCAHVDGNNSTWTYKEGC